jgi:hypothetical protein
LRGRIDLVVIHAVREDGHLVQILGKRQRRLGDVDKPFSISMTFAPKPYLLLPRVCPATLDNLFGRQS